MKINLIKKDRLVNIILVFLFLTTSSNCYFFVGNRKIKSELQETKNKLQYHQSYNLNSKSDNVVNNNKVNIDEMKELEDLHQIAIEVSNIFKKTGKGVPVSSGLDLILQADEANCIHHPYIFARKIQDLGYQFRILAITTAINWDHALIEVKLKTTGKWYLFDPSNGISYLNTLWEIHNNPELANSKIGQPSQLYQNYTLPKFFERIIDVTIYPDLGRHETDYALEAKIINQSSFMQDYSVANALDGDPHNNYTSSKENSYPNFFELDLGAKRKIYRFMIQWYNAKDYASNFEIFANNNGKYVSIFSTEENIEDDTFTEIILPEAIVTDKIKFVVYKNEGQNRLLLKKFSVYKF